MMWGIFRLIPLNTLAGIDFMCTSQEGLVRAFIMIEACYKHPLAVCLTLESHEFGIKFDPCN